MIGIKRHICPRSILDWALTHYHDDDDDNSDGDDDDYDDDDNNDDDDEDEDVKFEDSEMSPNVWGEIKVEKPSASLD